MHLKTYILYIYIFFYLKKSVFIRKLKKKMFTAAWRSDSGPAQSGDRSVRERLSETHGLCLWTRGRPTGQARGRLENGALQPDRDRR